MQHREYVYISQQKWLAISYGVFSTILKHKCQILEWRGVLCCTGNPSGITEIKEGTQGNPEYLHLFWHQYLHDVKGVLLQWLFNDFDLFGGG